MKPKVLVAMSGGVDSSVAAALLKKQGFDCIGVFMHLWSEEDTFDSSSLLSMGTPSSNKAIRAALMRKDNESHYIRNLNRCCSIEAQEQARRVAQKIGIPLYTVNYKKPFRDIVVENYIATYQTGKTPNPCVVCNQFIKFDLLLKEAEKQGCDFLATGHYAQIVHASEYPSFSASHTIPCAQSASESARRHFTQDTPSASECRLIESKDLNKDQTYFLYRLDQKKLSKILFPVGKYQKPEVRKMAKKFGLPTAERKDSRGICFVSTTNQDFLKKYLKTKPGDIVDVDGTKIGEHRGLLYYTVGQRHISNSQLALRDSQLGKKKDIPPLYVIDINIEKNRLVLGEEKNLYKKELIAEDVNWIMGKEPELKNIGARIRYRHPINSCTIKKLTDNSYQITFKEPQRAITPGQSVVLYQDGEVLGGGIIK